MHDMHHALHAPTPLGAGLVAPFLPRPPVFSHVAAPPGLLGGAGKLAQQTQGTDKRTSVVFIALIVFMECLHQSSIHPSVSSCLQVGLASYSNEVNSTGWAFLELQTKPNFPDKIQAYAAGTYSKV